MLRIGMLLTGIDMRVKRLTTRLERVRITKKMMEKKRMVGMMIKLEERKRIKTIERARVMWTRVM